MKKMLAMILAVLMVSALAVVPAYADTAATPVPAGTDLFADKNPGLEDTTDGAGGWEKKYTIACIAEHDKTDPNYRPEFGTYYYSVNADHQGSGSPKFTNLEGGRHYYLSFYIRNAKTRDEGAIRIDWYWDENVDASKKWATVTGTPIGIDTPDDASDDAQWKKLTYDILVPPGANAMKFTFGIKYGKNAEGETVPVKDGYDADNFSLIAGEEYITDNMLCNGSFEEVRGDFDPIGWDLGIYNTYKGNVITMTEVDDTGNRYFKSTSKGEFYQGVYLEGGETYKLSYRYRNDGNINTDTRAGISLTNKTKKLEMTSTIQPSELEKWETYTVYFTSTAEKNTLEKVCIYVGGSNISSNFKYDDVVLTKVTDPAEVTYATEGVKKDFVQAAEGNLITGYIWKRGTEASGITDFAAVDGVHPVSAYAYHFPKTAGETASLISAVYKENNGVKQLVNVKVTAATAADTNPVALTHTVDVKEADASSAWVESFVWTDMTKLAPITNSVYTLGK